MVFYCAEMNFLPFLLPMVLLNPNNCISNPLQRELLKIAEVAVMLGISQASVRRLIDRGLLKPNRSLRHLLISRDALQTFVNR